VKKIQCEQLEQDHGSQSMHLVSVDRGVFLYLLQTGCAWGVHVYSNSKLGQSVGGAPRFGKGYQAGRRSMLVSGGDPRV